MKNIILTQVKRYLQVYYPLLLIQFFLAALGYLVFGIIVLALGTDGWDNWLPLAGTIALYGGLLFLLVQLTLLVFEMFPLSLSLGCTRRQSLLPTLCACLACALSTLLVAILASLAEQLTAPLFYGTLPPAWDSVLLCLTCGTLWTLSLTAVAFAAGSFKARFKGTATKILAPLWVLVILGGIAIMRSVGGELTAEDTLTRMLRTLSNLPVWLWCCATLLFVSALVWLGWQMLKNSDP